MLKSPKIQNFVLLTDVFLLLHQVCGCPEASSHSKCLIYSKVTLKEHFKVVSAVGGTITKRAVCFVTRADDVIVLNGDQSFFPRDGHELMRSWLVLSLLKCLFRVEYCSSFTAEAFKAAALEAFGFLGAAVGR